MAYASIVELLQVLELKIPFQHSKVLNEEDCGEGVAGKLPETNKYLGSPPLLEQYPFSASSPIHTLTTAYTFLSLKVSLILDLIIVNTYLQRLNTTESFPWSLASHTAFRSPRIKLEASNNGSESCTFRRRQHRPWLCW